MGAGSWLWTGSASRLAVATALAGWMWSSIAQAKDFWAFESGHVLAGLDPGLAVPRKCNVLGPPNPADADGDAVPDDCAIDDIAFMLRAVSGAALPAGGVCELPLP
jgi:hypothetical protein